MAHTVDELVKTRKEKLGKLQKFGLSGFPAWSDDKWQYFGRITAIRGHGKLIFADLANASGKKQVSFKFDRLSGKWNIVELLDIGDFLAVSGENYVTQAGEPTIDVTNFLVLTKSLRPLPSSWYGFTDVEERYRQRYVDLLMNPEVKKIFQVRSTVIRLLRQKLDEAGFMEVETPVLQPIYGGATAKPFTTHHNTLDVDLYLRIAVELYLKRLIVGGFEKVYEIGKDFRNEGMDRYHNPEFTMLEFYWAYANYEDLMNFTQELISGIVKEVCGSYKMTFEGEEYDFTLPWQRLTFRDLILKETGIDINEVNTEKALMAAIKERRISLDLKGVIGHGALLDELYKKVARPKIKGPVFVTDYPYQMLPLAKKTPDGKYSASFQLLVAGAEFIKAYNELNDPIDQKARWEEEMKLAREGLEEHQVVDEDYVRALEYGMPPTAGWGMGIDRFVAFLTDQHAIKDTILFPAMRPESAGSKDINQDFDQKFVIAIDEKLPDWQVMNTSGHIAAFLGNKMTAEFDTGKNFLTRDGMSLPRNSQYPVITLSATESQLKKLAEQARESSLVYIAYVPEMMETTNDTKLEKALAEKNSEEVVYAGVGLFGPKTKVDALTKDLKLWGKS